MLQQDPSLSHSAATPRLRKPSVKDPRLLVGILLVGLSMWLGVWTINGAKDLSIAYVADTDVAAGQPVTRDLLRAVEVNLGDAEELYLSEALSQSEKYVASEPIFAGQLVAHSDIKSQELTDSRVIAITTSTPLSREIHVGGKVDLWALPASSARDVQDLPQEVATALVVSQLPDTSGSLGSARSHIAYVIVQASDIPAVLAVTGGDHDLTLLAEPR